MKKFKFLLISTTLILATSCGQQSSKDDETVNEQTQAKENISQIEEQSGDVAEESFEDKFLITNNSVGYFKIGGSWQNSAKNDYNYKYVQGYGTCTDACCDGGFALGSNLVINEHGWAENPEIEIGALIYKSSDSFDDERERNKYKNNKDVFYISSDNCSGWYWNDKINYLLIYSEKFKTKEGIGVGTTLEKLEEKYGNLHFYVGWIEEDENALQVVIKSYPNISFILDIDDYKGNWEEISLKEYENSLKVFDFKKDTKLQRLILKAKN